MHGTSQRISYHTRLLALWLLIGSLTIAVLAAGCGKREAEAVVTRRDITAYLALDGRVYVPPASDANILAPYAGTVDRVMVTVGASVKAGDALMQLNARQHEASSEQTRRNLANAKQDLAQAKQRYGDQLRQAQIELKQARQAEQTARKTAEQIPETTNCQATAVETTSPDLDAAIARHKAAEQAVLDTQAYTQSALAPYEQAVVTAQQAFDDARAGLKVAMVRTPIAGTVIEIRVKTGEAIEPDPDRPVARVVDLSAVKVYAEVPRDNLDEVEAKDPVVVTSLEVPGETFSGSVEEVYSKNAGFLKGVEYTAVVDFYSKKGQAKPGMDATASLKIGEVKDVLAVPTSAVHKVDGKFSVTLKVGREWHGRVVRIGLSGGNYTEIKCGLKEGDIVMAKS